MRNNIKIAVIGLAVLIVGTVAYVFTQTGSVNKDQYTPVPASVLEASSRKQTDTKLFVPATNVHWGLTNGDWVEVSNNLWNDVMFGTMNSVRDMQLIQIGRRAHFVTNSSFATLVVHNVGSNIKIYVDGSLKVEQKLLDDNKQIELPIYSGMTGKRDILVVWGGVCELAGIYISADSDMFLYNSTQKKMVVIGDAFVQGLLDKNPGMNTYTAQLNDKLGLEVINQGIMDTDVNVSYEKIGHSSGLDRLSLDVVYEKPDYVLVNYGQVAVQSIIKGDMTKEKYFEDYKNFIQQMRDALPNVKIFCSGVISMPAYDDIKLKSYNDGIKAAIAGITDTHFIDMSGCWNEKNYKLYLSDDMVNPNDGGHKFLADKYTEFIKPYLGN